MRPVSQTHGAWLLEGVVASGDCWPACLASILEVPIEQVPIPKPGGHWPTLTEAALCPHGHRAEKVAHEGLRGFWVAFVPSLKLGSYASGNPALHAVVMCGDVLAHDPALGRRYAAGTAVSDLDVAAAYVLVPTSGVSVSVSRAAGHLSAPGHRTGGPHGDQPG
jgi:hypothetical protein